MIYPKYGEAFRKLRLQHRLSLADFEHLGIAKSTLSHFENGKNMLAFDKLDMALQEMHTSLQDYALLVNNLQPDYFVIQFHKIEKAYLKKDYSTLKTIYQNSVDYPDKETYYIGLSAKSFYAPLNAEECASVERFLEGIKVWGAYELSIFTSTLENLNLNFVKQVMEEFWSYIDSFLSILEYRTLVMRAIVRVSFRLIDQNDKETAKDLVDNSRKILMPADTSNRIMLRFIEGYWEHAFEDEIRGKKQMRQVLHILKVIEAPDLRRIFLSHYNRRMKNAQQ